MEYEVEKSAVFDRWLKKLKDRKAVVAIATRLGRAQAGNFGDTESIGGGIREMRIFLGPGYRLYYAIRGQKIIIMLCGGNKSTQSRDIQRAKEMAKTI